MAILAVLLVYPTATPSAKSPSHIDGSTARAVTPSDDPAGPASGDSGGENEGDRDDLAGCKGTRPTGVGDTGPRSVFYPAGSMAKVWWMYLLNYVVIITF